MHQRKESLRDLIENVEFYKRKLRPEENKKGDLIRYYIANWKLYNEKARTTKVEKRRLNFQQNSRDYFERYCSFFTDPRNDINNYL